MNEKENAFTIFGLVSRFLAPLSSVVLMMAGTGFFTTFISVVLYREGYTENAIGMIQAAFFMGMFLGAFQMERVIRRVGHIQALAVFGSLGTSVILLQGLYISFPFWVVLRFFSGLSLAAIYIVIESWMLANSRVKERGVVLSLYMISFLGAQSFSQYFLTVIDVKSSAPYLISAAFTSLSIIPVGLSSDKITISASIEKIGVIKLLKLTPFGTIGCFISGLMLSVVYTFFPIFAAKRLLLSEDVMFSAIFGGIVLQWPLGKLSDYFERRITLLFTIFAALGIAFAAYTYSGYHSMYLLLLSFLIGGFAFALYPLSLAQVCDHISPSDITQATALMLITYGCGSVIGPLAVSPGIEVFGIHFIFLYFILILFGMAVFGVFSIAKHPPIPAKEQGEFLPLVSITPVACKMDPRSDDEEKAEKELTG